MARTTIKKINGIQRFRQAGNTILKKVIELRDCKKAVEKAVLELTSHANNLTSVLRRLDSNIVQLEKRRRFLHTSGVAATTLGSSLAAALWAMAYATEEEGQSGYYTPLAYLSTGVGIGGTVVKMGTAYWCSKSNQNYMKEVEATTTSHHGMHMSVAEENLNSKFKEMICLLKELYGESKHSSDPADHLLLPHRTGSPGTETNENEEKVVANVGEDGETAPLVMTVIETADSATCAPDVLSTVLEYSTDYGLESMEVLEQTYDAATTSLGEVISFGLLEGAANGLSLVVSSYEIYKLIGSWNKENPTSQKIEDLISNVQKKLKAYNNLKKCIEIVDTFTKLRCKSFKEQR